jgi:hypothetical protein
MDTSVITTIAAVAGAVSALAGLARVALESPLFKNGLRGLIEACNFTLFKKLSY